MKPSGSPLMALRMSSAMENCVKAFGSSAESRAFGCRADGRSRMGMGCNWSSISCTEEDGKSSAGAILSNKHTEKSGKPINVREDRERGG